MNTNKYYHESVCIFITDMGWEFTYTRYLLYVFVYQNFINQSVTFHCNKCDISERVGCCFGKQKLEWQNTLNKINNL